MSTLVLQQLRGVASSGGIIDVHPDSCVYNPGSIVQIQQTVKTDTFSAAPNGTWVDITGMTVTITPKKISSRIFILMTVVGAGSGTTPKIRLLRGSTAIGLGDTAGSRQSATFGSFLAKDTNQTDTYTQQFIDSPAAVTPITYRLQVNNDNTQTFFLNRSPSDQDNATGGRYISVITAMEIAV